MADFFEKGVIRKSFSAEKPKDSELVDILQVASKSNKSCASASFLSARANHRSPHGALDISPNYIKLESNEDHKLFLNASQTLEKLNRIITKSTENSGRKFSRDDESSPSQRNLSLRKIILYHDVLKNLLRERCALILKEECDICIKRTIRLIEDFRQLYVNEKLKMMTMPIQACNRFVNSNDTSFSTMELLIKKLQIICDLHSSISSSYQKIVNCFYIGFDMGLYLIVSKTNQTLSELKQDLYYWAHKSMTMFMKKLCLADPHSVSPDFLQSILEACMLFNLLVKDTNRMSSDSSKSCNLFHRSGINSNYTELPFSLVLNYLAYFEAKVASEKIVHFLTSSCKKLRHIDLKKKSDSSIMKKKDDTSDYSSAASDLDLENSSVKMFTVANINFNYTNVWTSIIQRNQSLILKYLYSITSLQSSSLGASKRRASFDSNAKMFSARPSWNLPDQSIQDERYILLEDMFWTSFWKNAQKFILKLLFEVPYHQYGDAVAGTIILWPGDFLHSLTECLKLNFNNTDVPSEGRYVIKQVYEHLLIRRKQLLWDQEFSLALRATHTHVCSLVLTVERPIRTHTGNILYSCLEILSDIFSEDHVDMDSLLTLKALRMLQTTLDCFNTWANTKTRALMSSQNLSSYLHVSCSDCSSSSKLLSNNVKSVLMTDFCSSSLYRISPNRRYLEQEVLTLIANLAGYQEDAPHILYKYCFSSVKDILLNTLKPDKSCTFFKESITNAIETFLFSLDEALEDLCDIFPLAQSIISGVSQAFFYMLYRKNLRFSSIQLLSTEFSKFLEWMDQLNLSEAEKEELKQKHSVKRICCLLKLIHKSLTRHRTCFKQRNKITPITEIQLDMCELSVEEKRILALYSRRIFSFCL